MLASLLLCAASLLAPPANFDQVFRAGLIALQNHDLAGAEQNLQIAVNLRPDSGRVWIALAQTYWKLHRPAEAQQAAAKAALLGENDPAVLQSLAIYYFEAAQPLLQSGKFTEAVALLQSATTKIGKTAQLQLALGVAYYGLRRFGEASDAFLASIALAPDNERPYLFLGRMLDSIPDRLPEVTKCFAAFEERNPANDQGYLLHAKALDAQRIEPETARKLLARAIAINANDASAHFELGALLDRMHLFPEAASELERAVQLQPQDAAAHYRLSRIYDRLGKPEAAEAERELHRKLVVSVR